MENKTDVILFIVVNSFKFHTECRKFTQKFLFHKLAVTFLKHLFFFKFSRRIKHLLINFKKNFNHVTFIFSFALTKI